MKNLPTPDLDVQNFEISLFSIQVNRLLLRTDFEASQVKLLKTDSEFASVHVLSHISFFTGSGGDEKSCPEAWVIFDALRKQSEVLRHHTGVSNLF